MLSVSASVSVFVHVGVNVIARALVLTRYMGYL